MIEIMGYSYNPLGLAIAILSLVFLMSHFSWWALRLYFPNARVCEFVHRSQPKCSEVASKLLSTVPTGVSPLGFLCSLLWPCIVCLNLLFLAQIFELFVPGGRRISLPWVGTYSVFPMIMGFLFAASESFLGIMWERSKKLGRRGYGWLLLVVITIAVEMGLAYYRARILTMGEQPISPTIWDKIMLEGGPALAALLGFIVPVVEIALSRIAFFEFIEPAAPAMVKWLGGVIVLLWKGFTWLFFGFHHKQPILLIPLISELKKKSKGLERHTENLQAVIGSLSEKEPSLSNLPEDFSSLKSEIDELQTELENKKHEWNTTVETIEGEVDKVSSLRHLQELGRKLRDFETNVVVNGERIQNKADSLGRCIEGLPHQLEYYSEVIASFQAKLDKAQNNLNDLKGRHKHLHDLSADVAAILNKSQRSNPILDEAQAKELQNLQKRAQQKNNEWALKTFDNYQEIVRATLQEKLPIIEAKLSSIANQLDAKRAKLNQFKSKLPPTPSSIELEDTANKIVDIVTRVGRLKKGFLSDIRALKKAIKGKQRLLKGKPAWIRFLQRMFRKRTDVSFQSGN